MGGVSNDNPTTASVAATLVALQKEVQALKDKAKKPSVCSLPSLSRKCSNSCFIGKGEAESSPGCSSKSSPVEEGARSSKRVRTKEETSPRVRTEEGRAFQEVENLVDLGPLVSKPLLYPTSLLAQPDDTIIANI